MQSSHSISISMCNSCFHKNHLMPLSSFTEVLLSHSSLIGHPEELASGQITHWLPRCCFQKISSGRVELLDSEQTRVRHMR